MVDLRIHCLGGGLVGSFVTRRLVQAGLDVHLYDVTERQTNAVFHLEDALQANHDMADFVVNMLPGSLGNKMTSKLKNSGLKIVDLSFSEITPDTLTDVTSSILWDVGIAPGLSNMLSQWQSESSEFLMKSQSKLAVILLNQTTNGRTWLRFRLMMSSLNTQDLQGLFQMAKK